jgi:hypothetical protein
VAALGIFWLCASVNNIKQNIIETFTENSIEQIFAKKQRLDNKVVSTVQLSLTKGV